MAASGERWRVPRWALPGELAAAATGGRPRRTVRDWLVDTVLFLMAAGWWAYAFYDYVHTPDPAYLAIIDDWMVTVDPYVGAAVCVAVWWRRRFPILLAAAALVGMVAASTGTGALLVALFTVAVHRSWLPATILTAVALFMGLSWSALYQPPELDQATFMVYLVLMFGVPLGWGMMVRFRRQLLLELRRDAQRERDERHRRLSEARRTERTRLAREMHDVLAHRISLLSVHAGALAYRTAQAEAGQGQALSATEVGEAATVIRDNAHWALDELSEVLAVLRAGEPAETEQDSRQPPPQLSDLPRLVAEARAAGQRITCEVEPGADQAPAQEQRTAYRVVQEGLTNARKHAPHAPVTVRVAGAPGQGVRVCVSNPLPTGVTAAGIPGAGAGLAGLAERVGLDGGELDHGVTGGVFRLRARLPWRA